MEYFSTITDVGAKTTLPFSWDLDGSRHFSLNECMDHFGDISDSATFLMVAGISFYSCRLLTTYSVGTS